MTEIILDHYEINKATSALLPAYHNDYQTTVWEEDQRYYVKKTPLQLIKEACLEGGADYNGRRAAVTHKTGVNSKVPIPVLPHEQIYAFPTHSPKLYECHWLFYHHIKSIHRHPDAPSHTIITFIDSKELLLHVSYYTIEKQLQRTSYCMTRFTHYPSFS
ncbi:competence protein ComK [Alkalihalobacterium alkalinitrilicum]|uniref:competence protein ComK n=1 Tax=Alkalihalobacterium alkalinitrilicum TaxID=427920 RepID=UPI0009959A92|nr:competence protein ComK [Alkalihalobacterium alkalinitrilicum]